MNTLTLVLLQKVVSMRITSPVYFAAIKSPLGKLTHTPIIVTAPDPFTALTLCGVAFDPKDES